LRSFSMLNAQCSMFNAQPAFGKPAAWQAFTSQPLFCHVERSETSQIEDSSLCSE
jgi:hypothetical protein